jgi:hypothetical protein
MDARLDPQFRHGRSEILDLGVLGLRRHVVLDCLGVDRDEGLGRLACLVVVNDTSVGDVGFHLWDPRSSRLLRFLRDLRRLGLLGCLRLFRCFRGLGLLRFLRLFRGLGFLGDLRWLGLFRGLGCFRGFGRCIGHDVLHCN